MLLIHESGTGHSFVFFVGHEHNTLLASSFCSTSFNFIPWKQKKLLIFCYAWSSFHYEIYTGRFFCLVKCDVTKKKTFASLWYHITSLSSYEMHAEFSFCIKLPFTVLLLFSSKLVDQSSIRTYFQEKKFLSS